MIKEPKETKNQPILISSTNEIPNNQSHPGPGTENQNQDGPSSEQFTDPALEDLCKDLVTLPFEAWTMFSLTDKSLGDFERNQLGIRLARIFQKHNIDRYIKDEIIFAGLLGVIIVKRVRAERAAVMEETAKKKKAADDKKDQEHKTFTDSIPGSQK